MNEGTSILVVDDEEQILRVLRPTLEAQGYTVTTAETGASALALLERGAFAAVILDLGLPDCDGKDVIRRARAFTAAPILVLSARDVDTEKIAALDGGADDYVAKPFSAGELLARLRVLLRASPKGRSADTFEVAGLLFDFRRRTARLHDRDISLSGRETAFLRLLAERDGDVATHREIILAVWGDLERADAQFVRVLAGQIRQKIEEDPAAPAFLITVPGVGYQLGRP